MGAWKKRVVSLVLGCVLGTIGLLFTLPATACACGAFLMPEGERVSVSQETAVISFDGETERILLTLDVDAPHENAALLIPTPTPATVSVGQAGMAEELAQVTAPVVERVNQWWPGDPRGDTSAPRPAPPAPPVTEVEGVDVDLIEAAKADDLEDWLKKSGYVLRDDIATALKPYIQQGWYFALITLDTETLTGRIGPLDISFGTNQLVYPMRLSVAQGPLLVRTYIFADHRMERTDSMGGSLKWAGSVPQTRFTNQTLVDLARDFPFLTVWEQRFTDPRTQVDQDMVFAASSNNTAYHEVQVDVVRKEIFGTLAGPTLVFGALIIVGFGGGWYSRHRRKSTSTPSD